MLNVYFTDNKQKESQGQVLPFAIFKLKWVESDLNKVISADN